MQKIIPYLWFNKEAAEAARFYTSVFPESRVNGVSMLKDTPSGDVDTVTFEIWGQQFRAMSAGARFRFNRSISFIINFDPSRYKHAGVIIDAVWEKLSEGGKVLMPLDQYPFSKRYGWIEDKYGLSWQLILSNPEGDPRPPVTPSLLFTGKRCGMAEEAVEFYHSVFSNTGQGQVFRYPEGLEHEVAGTIMFSDFMLEGQWFAAVDSAMVKPVEFNEAISLMVLCETQEEIDHYWEALSAVPDAEQCGWLKDKYGVSWQIVPAEMEAMITRGTREQTERVTQAFMPMKKLEIEKLRKAFAG